MHALRLTPPSPLARDRFPLAVPRHSRTRLVLKALALLIIVAAAYSSRAQSLVEEKLSSVGALGLFSIQYPYAAPRLHWLRPDGTAVLLSDDINSVWDLSYQLSPSLTPDEASASLTSYELRPPVAGAELPLYTYSVGSLVHPMLFPPDALVGQYMRASLILYPGGADNAQSNFANRSHASASDPAIAGFVLDRPRWVLLRAVGPSLASFGVSDPCPRPVMTIHRGDRHLTIRGRRDTTDSLSQLDAAAELVGAFPLLKGSADCALLLYLTPGPCPIVAQPDAGTSTGTVLIEAYFLPFGEA